MKRRAAALVIVFLAVVAAHAAVDGINLDAEARRIAQQQLKRFGRHYTARIDPSRRLVYVTALDKKHLEETAVLLARYADAQRRVLLSAPLRRYLTVILPTAKDYWKLAPAKNVMGFYQAKDSKLISIDRGRVLVHEFTHALHHADAEALKQIHPIWIREGFATLFEAGRITAKGLEPQVDARLINLQKALRTKKAFPLGRLLRFNDRQFMKDAELCYAQSRYLMLYLHERGLLKKWYERYKAGFAKDRSGLKALEKLLRKRIPDIDSDWSQWVAKLRLPWGESRAHEARLGIRTRDDSQGPKVVGLAAGGAAEGSGLIRVGDIIEEFDGRPTPRCAHLIAAIRAAGAKQTVTVHLRRQGRRVTIHQPLGALAPAGSKDRQTSRNTP